MSSMDGRIMIDESFPSSSSKCRQPGSLETELKFCSDALKTARCVLFCASVERWMHSKFGMKVSRSCKVFTMSHSSAKEAFRFFRILGAPSRRAWQVFSRARSFPISIQRTSPRELYRELSLRRKRPPLDLIVSTIFEATFGLSLFFARRYRS